MNQDTQPTSNSGVCPKRTAWREYRGVELLIVGLAVVGALCLLPFVAALLGLALKLALGLIGLAVGLICAFLSLVLGLTLGALGLLVSLLGACLGFLVSPPGVILMAILIYFMYEE